MSRFTRLIVVVAILILPGCADSIVILHVSPDGHGRAVITTRLYEANLRAFDGMFTGSPTQTPLDQELPPPEEGGLARQFGTGVKLASSKFEKTPDGAMRTSIVEFEDVTKLRMDIVPAFGGATVHVGGITDQPVISFAMKPHDNGDRLLLVRLPDGRIAPEPDPQMTVLKTDSPEELAFKRAIGHMAVRLYVEMEDVPLLRTNAPVTKGNRATILDLDLDKIINGLDEDKVRRAMSPGSMQEMLWQLGDMPGAIVPVDHEVFLEFETPQPQQPAAPAQPAAQAPPDTEIYLAPLKNTNGRIEVGEAINITNSPGYDNQPSFTPDGRAIVFTSVRGPSPGLRDAAPGQTDIYRYDIASREISRVTQTVESEYSPTVMLDGTRISVIRVETDGTQRLWSIAPSGPKIQSDVVLRDVKPVGYHAWADDHTLALFVLGQPPTLQLADTRTGTARIIASDVGRSIQRMPGSSAARDISFVQRERAGDVTRLIIKKLTPATGAVSVLTPAVDGATEADTAWTPDGTLLMAKGATLYGWRQGQPGWTEIAALERLSLRGVTRLAVSPKGDYLALVSSPR